MLPGSFDPDWGRDLEPVLEVEHKEAVKSVVGLRNSIAHRGMVGLIDQRIADYYYDSIQRVVERVAVVCGAA
jgi:hypothetical protein